MKGETDWNAVLDEWTFTVVAQDTQIMEKRIRLLLQPKPLLLPEFAWRKLVARLIRIEETQT